MLEDIYSRISMLYIATFGRAPDSAGLDYWVYDSGLNIEEIAQSFFDQTETKMLYPEDASIEDFIISIYQNLFSRQPDSSGFLYWQSELESGRISKSHFILAVINGALGDDAVLLQNQTEVGLAFSENGLDDIALAHSVLDRVTAEEDSVVNALRTIDYIVENENDSEIKKIAYVENSHVNSGLDSLSNFDTFGVRELDSGHRWGDDVSVLTYSFNTTLPDEYGGEDSQNWQELNNLQKYTVRQTMNDLSSFLNLHFVEVPDDRGAIRFNIVDMQDDMAGYTYLPDENDDVSGDVFLSQIFNTDDEYRDLSLGGVARRTIAHEIGHSLGLKHPFEGSYVLPIEFDDSNHTIMSYTDNNNLIPIFTKNEYRAYADAKYIYSQSYSLYDIDTLQAIYGANTNTNTANDIYTSKYTDYKIYTIWDAGGVDTIDLSNNRGQDFIDMHDNTINSADVYSFNDIVRLEQDKIDDDYYNDWIRQYILELYRQDKLYMGENNLSIAKGVVIENINTGINSDLVVDNEVDNHISTSLGDDNIYLGSGGFDTVFGGEGFDTVHLLNMQKEDLKVDMLGDDDYIIKGDGFAAEIIGVEYIYFDSIDSGYLPSELVA